MATFSHVFTRTGDMGHLCADHRMGDGIFWPVWAAKRHLDEASFMSPVQSTDLRGPVDETKYEINREVHISVA